MLSDWPENCWNFCVLPCWWKIVVNFIWTFHRQKSVELAKKRSRDESTKELQTYYSVYEKQKKGDRVKNKQSDQNQFGWTTAPSIDKNEHERANKQEGRNQRESESRGIGDMAGKGDGQGASMVKLENQISTIKYSIFCFNIIAWVRIKCVHFVCRLFLFRSFHLFAYGVLFSIAPLPFHLVD